MKRLREKWPWNPEFLKAMLIVPSAMGIATTIVLYPFAKHHALWFLTTIICGGLLYQTYASVGKRVSALLIPLNNEPGELAEGLIVIGKIEAPGVIVLKENELILIPIVGKRKVIPFSEINNVTASHWLPGKFVWGKTALHLSFSQFSTNKATRTAFAVTESIRPRWRRTLLSKNPIRDRPST